MTLNDLHVGQVVWWADTTPVEGVGQPDRWAVTWVTVESLNPPLRSLGLVIYSKQQGRVSVDISEIHLTKGVALRAVYAEIYATRNDLITSYDRMLSELNDAVTTEGA